MKLFEIRNVFDRVESTWNTLMTKNWKTTILPQFYFSLIGWWIGLVCMIFWGRVSFSLIPLIPQIHEPIDMLLFTEPLLLFLLWAIVFSVMDGIIETYTLTVFYEYKEGLAYTQIFSQAIKRIWSWMCYIGWLILVISLILSLSLIFALFTHLWWIFIFVIPGVMWFKVALWPGQVGYILTGATWVVPFLHLIRLSRGRWWRIFGNILLIGIIVGSAYSVVQQLLLWVSGINDIIAYFMEYLYTMDTSWNTVIEWWRFLGKFTPVDFIQMAVGYTIGLMLYTCQQIFLYGFQYTVYKDIETEGEITSS